MVQLTRFRSRGRLLQKTSRLARTRSAISGTMSSRFPQTEPVFRRLRIDRRREGYESAGELARHRGMEDEYVLLQLRDLANVFPGSRVVQD